MVTDMRQVSAMGRLLGVGIVMGLSLSWSLSHAGTIRDGRSEIGPATSNTISTMISSVPAAMEAAAGSMPSASVALESAAVLRTVPTVSKPISVGGMTLRPYIGAGFGGGYATELDRSLNPAQSASSSFSGSSNAGPRSLLGQNLIPNEVQLGIRFPF